MAMGRKGMVATSHTLATLAGLDMLRAGGTAMDAAVTAGAVLAVVEPMMTGIGGDAWVLYYEAKTGRVHGLNGSGRAPKRLTRDHFDAKGRTKIDAFSWEAVTVPGAVDAYATALRRFGRKSLGEVLEPAIALAEHGFPVTEKVHAWWVADAEHLRKDRWAAATYLHDGQSPQLGELFQNPNLARSLRAIASGGPDAFYRGPIAQEIVRYGAETSGFLTLEDFANHASSWVEPIHVDYRGYEVYQCPPNGQGVAVLLMLNLLEGFELSAMRWDSPEYLHLLIEAKKLAFADLYRYVADPDHANVPVGELLSKQYAAKRRTAIDLTHAAEAVEPGMPIGGDTVYLTVVDSEGNAASFISSLYAAFGARIVGGSTGILLHNRGSAFTLERGHPNEYQPGKRPFHTIIPGMVLRGCPTEKWPERVSHREVA